MQKTPEDEAFDDLARRQGAWGGGFPAKRQSAIDKINAAFDEEYIKYRAAFPKEYTAASVLGDQAKYGTSWSKDGERIDPMSVYKEPKYAARAFWEKDGRIGVAVTIVRPDGGVHVLQKTIDPPQSAQEPVAHIPLEALEQIKPPMLILNNVPIYGYAAEGTVAVYTTPPQREWVGLTDEERDDLLDTHITAEGRARAIEQYLKEKNT